MKRRKKGKGILIMLTCIFFSLLIVSSSHLIFLTEFRLSCVETVNADVQELLP